MKHEKSMWIASLAALLVGVGPAGAQERVGDPLELGLGASGLHVVDGQLVGAGPRYRATFDGRGMAFEPALGGAAAAASLRFELLELGREEGPQVAGGAAEPQRGAGRVTYLRGQGIEERYEVRADGVHQSFLFPRPLVGQGDLVVRGRLRVEGLELDGNADAGGLRFAQSPGSGVRIGAVTGIDAAGASAPGTLSAAGGLLELRLPEAFVEGAAYPLLLDPLIGTQSELSLTDQVMEADVAYEQATDTYLAVWSYQASAADHWLRAASIDADTGAATLITADMSGIDSYQPSVATVADTGQFIVGYRDESNGSVVNARKIDAAEAAAGLGGVSSEVLVGLGSRPDVGGSATLASGTFDPAFMVWQGLTTIGLKYQPLRVPAGAGAPTLFGSGGLLDTSMDARRPAVTKSHGESGRYLICWMRGNEVRAVVASSGGVVFPATETQVSLGLAANAKDAPDVDGDGDEFLVVWQRAESLTSSDNDIVGRSVEFVDFFSAPSLGVVRFLMQEPGLNERSPSVAWAGPKAVVAAAAGAFLPATVRLLEVDFPSGEACEDYAALPLSLFSSASEPAIASQRAGSELGGDGLAVAWEQGPIQFQQLELFGGSAAVDLGGGCSGGGGHVFNGSIALGNPDLEARLEGADLSAGLAYFAYRTAAVAPVTLGSCTTIVTAGTTLLGPVAMSGGAAQLTTPLPCDEGLVGAKLRSQWLVLGTLTSPVPGLPGIAVSNLLEFELQY